MEKNIKKTIVSDFSNHISSFKDMGVNDYEYSNDENNIRVFVDFGVCFPVLEVDKIDILDSDYDNLDNQLALDIREGIRKEVEYYNSENKEYHTDGYNIFEELSREKYYFEKYNF